MTTSPDPLVSVIVAVYNVGPYLQECLDSVAAQTYRELEIIVIDDGSSDASPGICDDFAQRDRRVAVVHQRNQGPSAARNVGLDRARGAFISFVDSDDVLARDFVAELVSDALAHDADLVVTGFVAFAEAAPDFVVGDDITLLRGPSDVESLVTGQPPRWAGPTKLYRAHLFSDLRFHEGVLYEDLELAPRLLPRLRVAVVRDDRLYGYRQRTGSIMDRTRQGISPDLITVLERNIDFAHRHLSPASAERLRTCFILHASRSLEYLAPGEPWRASRAYRRSYRRFIRRHAAAIASNGEIAPAYRGLLLLSAISTTGFQRAFGCARWLKARRVPLRRVHA